MLRNLSFLVLPHALLAAAIGLAFVPGAPAAAVWTLAAAWAVTQGAVMVQYFSPRGRLFAPGIWRAAPQPRVALTFDDGPDPADTPAILDALREAGARATFFFVGKKARAHPDLVRRASLEGHEVGVHSDSHPWWFSLAGAQRTRRELEHARDTLSDLCGKRPRHFRPPMGHKNIFLDAALHDAGLEMATWSARAYDTFGGAPDSIRKRLVARARPGGILVLHEGVRRRHDGASPTVRALPGIIADLRARGLEPVSLEDLRALPQRHDPDILPAP